MTVFYKMQGFFKKQNKKKQKTNVANTEHQKSTQLYAMINNYKICLPIQKSVNWGNIWHKGL